LRLRAVRVRAASRGLAWACGLALVAGSGCDRVSRGGEGGGGPPPIEITSWWQKVGAIDQMGGLVSAHHRRSPDDLVIQSGAGLSGLKRRALRARMLRNTPPDTFEANAGGDLLQWVLVNGVDATESKLLPLDDLVEGVAEWRRAVPPAILEQVSYQGKIYGVPVNVYRINTIFYNARVFRRFGLTEPTTLADFPVLADKLGGSGVSLIAMGSRDPWTLALLTFECLLVAREGPGFYTDYFKGRVAADDARVVRTLQAALELGRFFNPNHARLSWSDAVEMVADGRAAMTVMGEWAEGEFQSRGMRLGVDFREIPFPGSDGTFVFTADSYGLPAAAKNEAGARRLLATMGTPEGQHAVNDGMGALSARLDVPAPPGAGLAEVNHALLERGALVLALSGLVPPLYATDVGASLVEMLAEHDVEPVVHTLRSRRVLLR